MPIDTLPVTAGLIMDRSKPIGNSEGSDDRGRLHVKVSNKDTEPIPVTISDSEPGEPFFLDTYTPATPGTAQTLISHTVLAGTKLYLSLLALSCRTEGECLIKKDGSIIGTCRTGPGQPDASFNWIPRRECLAGSLVEVVFTPRPSSPIVSIGAHLMGLTQSV